MVDAGSSHTSLKVYRWPGEKENDTGLVKQYKKSCHSDGMASLQGIQYYSYVTLHVDSGGAISQYIYDPSKAGPSLKGCLDNAKEIVPHDRRSDTPIFLGATAGMRMLK